MSTAGFFLPMLRLPRPTLTAWVLPAPSHMALLSVRVALPFSAPQPGAFREMEVTLTMSDAAPAPVRQRAAAAVMATAASSHTPTASSGAENTGGTPHDAPLGEWRDE